jgi:hypothetical protein
MTEAELLMLHMELLNSVWSINQVWIGATSAVIVSLHLAASRFNLFLLSAMLFLYALFSTACAVQSNRLWGRISTVRQDLVSLRDSGVEITGSSTVLIENIGSGFAANAVSLAFSAIFFATVIYSVYCYRKVKRDS